MDWSSEQDQALKAVSDWLKRPDQQVFRLFGYAGTGKTTLARHVAEGIKGDVAFGEIYFQAFHRVIMSGMEKDLFVSGRYVDRYERRGGVWKIVSRVYVMDWNRNVPSTCEWTTGIYATLNNRGAREPDDLLYKILTVR